MADKFFENPPPGIDLSESRTATNNAIGIVLFVLSLVFVMLRLFTRLKVKREALGLDDYLMFLGLALNAGNLACCIAGGFFGLGKHIWSLGPYEMRQITIITFAYVFIYAWSVCIIKFSILALYRRIFGMSLLGWFCVALTTGYLITNHIVLPLYTRPLSYYWNQWYGASGEVLVNEAKFYLGVGIINLFGDICILTVPVSSVLKLNMERTQKIAICLVFLLGSFVCFASLYRIITITRLVRTRDISWAKSDVFIWSSVEPSVGIISGCLPTLRPLMMRLIESWLKYLPKKWSSASDDSAPQVQLSPLETISKKKTRKIKKDDLNSTQHTQMESHIDVNEHGAVPERKDGTKLRIRVRKDQENTGNWRPDEEEMCLTTTTVQTKDKDVEESTKDKHSVESAEGITMTREFDWDEATRR